MTLPWSALSNLSHNPSSCSVWDITSGERCWHLILISDINLCFFVISSASRMMICSMHEIESHLCLCFSLRCFWKLVSLTRLVFGLCIVFRPASDIYMFMLCLWLYYSESAHRCVSFHVLMFFLGHCISLWTLLALLHAYAGFAQVFVWSSSLSRIATGNNILETSVISQSRFLDLRFRDAFYVSHLQKCYGSRSLRMFISACCSSGTWCPCIVGCVRFYSYLIWHAEWWHCSCAACIFPRQASAVLSPASVCCQVDTWIDDAISCESKVWIAVDHTEGLS